LSIATCLLSGHTSSSRAGDTVVTFQRRDYNTVKQLGTIAKHMTITIASNWKHLDFNI